MEEEGERAYRSKRSLKRRETSEKKPKEEKYGCYFHLTFNYSYLLKRRSGFFCLTSSQQCCLGKLYFLLCLSNLECCLEALAIPIFCWLWPFI